MAGSENLSAPPFPLDAAAEASVSETGEEECAFCGQMRGPHEFEDGLRCRLCAEAQDADDEAKVDREPPTTDEERFTEGDCHLLAFELARRNFGALAALDVVGDGQPDWHAFVIDADGNAIDFYGRRPIKELLATWKIPRWRYFRERDFADWTTTWWDSPQIAEDVADELAKQLGLGRARPTVGA